MSAQTGSISSRVPRAPSVDSSACSTASSAGRHDCLFNKVPKKPDEKDDKNWCSFLAAYQNGNWEDALTSNKECSKQARRVQQTDGTWLDNRDFYNRYQYLAAPPAPKEKVKERNATINRYQLNSRTTRPDLDRYVKHAKSVFRVDYAAISVSCTEDRSSIFLAKEGSTDMATTATNTICDHAMLLEENEVFVVPDLIDDWRFQHFQFRSQKSEILRFYASAPLLLANAEDGSKNLKKVQVGRLTIMRHSPWRDFGEAEAHILMDIAKMASESLENEFLHHHAKKMQRMLRELSLLSYNMNLETDEDMSREKAKETSPGLLLCPPRMRRVTDLIRSTMGATTVVAIDVTEYRLQGPRADSSFLSPTSPRGSIQYGSYPAMPWLRSSSSGAISQEYDADAGSSSQKTPSESAGSEEPDTMMTSPSEIGPVELPGNDGKPGQKRPTPHGRTSSTAVGSLEDGTRYIVAHDTLPKIVVMSGKKDHQPSVESASQAQEIGSLLTKMYRAQKLTKPLTFQRSGDDEEHGDEFDDDDDDEGLGPYDEAAKDPLASLMSSETKTYSIVPVFANDRIQPLFLLMAIFAKKRKTVTDSERMFFYSTGVIVGSVCLRQQARLADSAQLDFIRSVQHELRTPLNGILGITDFLRQSLVSGDMTGKLDLTEDGLLASLLESIRLSGVNLSNILDDVLDFGSVSGLRNNDQKTRRIEEVDLVREVEDGCLDELEHIAMHERQDQKMKVYQGYYSVPTLVIRVAPELQRRFRTDRSKVKKILSKFVANALRYSNEHELVEVTVVPSQSKDTTAQTPSPGADQWIDFIVQDTGIGMSAEFLNNSLLKPFSKADSFTQGVGLGVTIAASLISQMGGRLSIQSELGKGTRVLFSLPFGERPNPIPKSTLSQPHRPYQVKTASFTGFVLKGQKKIVELIRERLTQNGITIVDSDQDAELVILKETALAAKSDDDEDQPPQRAQTASAQPPVRIPRPVGPKARVMVVTRNALRSRNVDALEGLPVWLFRPPFGPSTLEAMDEYLREESPVELRTVPKPTAAAEDNMKRVLNKQTAAASTPPPLLPKDEAHDTTVERLRGTTPATPAKGLQSPLARTVVLADVGDKTGIDKGEGNLASRRASNHTVRSDAASSTTKEKPFRILVVEDNYVNMRLITAVLTKGGYSFVEAKDGVEAVDQYKAFQPSIVLLDISLPLMDGFEACIQMRAHQMDHAPKIIAITALSSTEDKIKGLEVCGMDDWRTKPLSIKALRTDLVVWKKEWEEAYNTKDFIPALPQSQLAPIKT